MDERALTPSAVIKRAAHCHAKLQQAFREARSPAIVDRWPELEERLKRIEEESHSRPEVEISLVGGTGAGKSTLLNALIGARVLPVSNMRACTAAISEVAFSDDIRYRAQIQFIPRKVWQQEVNLLLADINDENLEGDLADLGALDIPRAARDKLLAVYGSPNDVGAKDLDLRNLKEPAEIAEALDKGSESLEAADLNDFRKQIEQYLSSKHCFWPLVQSVRISGPFQPLRGGAKLVDLPGINDPNEAREEVTRQHIKTCRFVWLVFNVKRVLTKDTIAIIQSEDFLRQIVMDGRAGALTFVGTHSDDLDPETGREEFGLDEDAPEFEVVQARNEAVRVEVKHQLSEVAARLAHDADEDPHAGRRLADAFQQSEIFTVSAREYLRLRGMSKAHSAGLETLDQTEVPALLEHMEKTCSGYGVEARARAHHRQIDLILEEVANLVSSQRLQLREFATVSEGQRKELRVAAQAARSFLVQGLQDLSERFEQDLAASEELLRERLKRAVDRGRVELGNVAAGWFSMHPATLRAIARRDGTYVGSTGRHNFPAQIAKPVLDGIAFAWTDFFGDKLNHLLEKWTSRLLLPAATYRDALQSELLRIAGPKAETAARLARLLEGTEKVIDEQLKQAGREMIEKIEGVQRSLYEDIPRQVAANMRPAFQKAAAEHGTGMRARVIGILTQHATEVSGVMFQDAQQAIFEGLRNLNDWLARKYNGMEETIVRHSDLMMENMETAVGGLSEEAMTVRDTELGQLDEALAEPLLPPSLHDKV